ncbi:ras GTPase-activating protein-binding protein 1 isoform X1 [Prunus yedoensis var. nudiflora]|uniref:Ras GTPase-activating protein-binding protein 1 isoform X1 n=1 Tax=Prunus yedoensis var. nudiflora TaxID=2094558 RepID=A0A314UH95_PRUYE|nr:ras GTPase-activating protein-binding protein 1 isoform X1 [Prunus yedoensis var. nudiflora]
MQEASPASAPSAQLVGNAFVEQYYHILHESPQLVHRFYQDSSSLSRTDVNGNMATVTTMQAISQKIQSLNYGDYTAEIKTADSQESYEKGVIVLVTGCLTGKDNVGRKFAQTFFLAPQEKGYYVLNDVFRYIEDNESLQTNNVLVNGINESAPEAILTAEPEPTHAPDHLVVDHATSFEEEDLNNGPEVCDPSDNDEGSVIEEEVVEPPAHSSQNQVLADVDPTPDPAPETQEDVPKKSYASIVKVMKSNAASSPVRVPTRTVRTISANTDHQSLGYAKPAPTPVASAPSGDAAPESSNAHEEAEGHSIHVRNLPYDATVAQLEKEFKKFGPIKRDGIQVRSSKQGFCFGFVEFETLSSMQSALEASPITIGDRPAVIEEKRTTTRVSSGGRGRFSSGRAGFRSDSFRGRGNYGGGRSYGRNEFRNQGEFSGRARGSAGRNGEGYQRVNLNGRGGGRQGAANRSSVPA